MRINKPYTNKEKADLASYCNHNNCHIEDKGKYLESVKNGKMTEEDKSKQVRYIRNKYLSDIDWRIIRYINQKELNIETTDSEELLQYAQYLRDIPNQKKFPNIEVLTFEEWSKLND